MEPSYFACRYETENGRDFATPKSSRLLYDSDFFGANGGLGTHLPSRRSWSKASSFFDSSPGAICMLWRPALPRRSVTRKALLNSAYR